MDKQYIDFEVAPYALPTVVLALAHNGVHSFAVTKEDNDLHIRIDEDVLMEAVYRIKRGQPSSDISVAPGNEVK